ncbi:MAG: RDD family protein [Mycobacterium sp.]|uniref:RDD family protein n=1 Tax=Mycobacterium sp. TaxID=1785 RepID=UPI001EBA2D24|nr:RDD family protein [Mycobacterium sp.]MBW0016329.1 RDD family protein [Mycobacterium sp.]
MTVVVDEKRSTAAIPESPPVGLAPWHIRAAAFAVDVLPGAAVFATMALVSFTVPARGAWWWVSVSVLGAAILLTLVDRLLLPAITGWSLGRALFGIAVSGCDGTPTGPWRLLVRDLAHLLDTAGALVGWFWPLWDSRRRTFADMLVRTEVRLVDPDRRPAGVRRWSAVAVLSAAGICLAGAGLSYAVGYAQDRATDRTRAQIAVQGPKIVAQILTYDPNTLEDDFKRALSLATNKYRGELAAQQDEVKKGQPVSNEYRSIDSSIQSASPDRATMLLFMDGRRGAPPNERIITATLRVTFVKDRDDQWRVDALDVLAKPKPPGTRK